MPIQPKMRPSGAPAMPRHPDWPLETSKAERIDKLVSSACRLNAWRVLNTKAWADPGSAPEAWAVVRALEGLVSEADALASGLGHADPRATLAGWVQDWLQACHVTIKPALEEAHRKEGVAIVAVNAPPAKEKRLRRALVDRYTLEVGGSAGALAVAILDELVAAPHVAICSRLLCLTTWTVGQGWDATIVSGRDDETIGTLTQGPLCPRCRGAVDRKERRTRPR